MTPKPHSPIIKNNQSGAEQCGDLNNACSIDIEGFTNVDKHSGDTFTNTKNLKAWIHMAG